MNSHYQVIKRLTGGNGLRADLHEFQLKPDGIAYGTASNRSRDHPAASGRARGITDNAIQEIEQADRPGAMGMAQPRTIEAAESEVETPRGTARRGTTSTSTRSIPARRRPADLGASTLGEIRLQGGSGRILCGLGGNRAPFKMGPGTRTAWQHGARDASERGDHAVDDGANNPPIHKAIRGPADRTRPLKKKEAGDRILYARPPATAADSPGTMPDLPAATSDRLRGPAGDQRVRTRRDRSCSTVHEPYDMTLIPCLPPIPWSAVPASPPMVFASQTHGRREERDAS